MGTNNPIFIDDYGDGYSFAIHCEKHGLDSAPWTMAVEVFKDEELALPRCSDRDNSYATYETAKEAGIRLARKIIDQLKDRAS